MINQGQHKVHGTDKERQYMFFLCWTVQQENVYMLSMIDESDLAEFVTETKKQETEQPTVITPQPETNHAVEETERAGKRK